MSQSNTPPDSAPPVPPPVSPAVSPAVSPPGQPAALPGAEARTTPLGVLRLAQEGEAPLLHALVQEAYAPWVEVCGQRPGPMDDDYAAHISAGHAWVLVRDGRILGILVVEDTPDALLLDNIALAPSARGTGAAKLLMEFAEELARTRGYTAIVLYTHEKMLRNVQIYTARGYVETHRGVQNGFPRVFMRKPLD